MPVIPRTLAEALRYFADPDRSVELAAQAHWPNGVRCPMCGTTSVRFLSTRRMWECAVPHRRRQFSARTGTVLAFSSVAIDKWLGAIWMLANAPNRVTSRQLQRALGVTQKTAWLMLRRLDAAIDAAASRTFAGS